MRPALVASGIVGFSILACSDASPPPFTAAAHDRALVAGTAVDPAALERHVRALFDGHRAETPTVSPWVLKTTYTHVSSAAYLVAQLGALGLTPVIERSVVGGQTLSTVYADIPGAGPEQVLLTGHHDVWLQSGADDNASAMAVLLEAARVLKDTKPRRTIRIVAFDGEEEDLLGSQHYLEVHRAEPIAIVVNMDCVAYASHEPGSQDAPTGLGLRDTGDFLAVIANERAGDPLMRGVRLGPEMTTPLDVLGLLTSNDGFAPGTGDFLRSDHAVFWSAGIPALFVTDTADFRNHNYHTADDTPETLDYEFFTRVARFVIGLTAALAEDG